MAFLNFGLNWFDFLVAIALLAGVNLGNKRGMSKEVIIFLQWCTIILVAALFYPLIGQLLSQWTGIGEMTGYVLAYLFLAAIVKLIYAKINQSIGEKIESRHPFGRMEYYFGPVACGIRFACIILLTMALLHAGRQSMAQTNHEIKRQKDNFGEVYFPTIGLVCQEVFQRSVTGKFVSENLPFLLITPSYQRQASL